MCISCVDTRNDLCGIGQIFNGATNMVLVGGLTAIVAAFAAAYFESGAFATAALSTTASIGAAIAITGGSILAVFVYTIITAFSNAL